MQANLSLRSALLLFLVVFGAVFGALWLNRVVESRQPVSALADDRAPQSAEAPFDFSEAARRVVPSVVSIDTAVRSESLIGEARMLPAGSGSGVVVQSDGYIVTNAHVVRNPNRRSSPVAADVVTVKTSDGKGYDARVVGIDELSDLAVVKVEATNLVPASFGDSDAIQVGDWVFAVGNQLGFDNSLSVGVVSSKNRWLETNEASILIDAIQTDATINPGNSGGPLCNLGGEVVGINSTIATYAHVASGVGFAVPAKHVKRVVKDLMEFGAVQYAVLGIEPAPPTFSLVVPQDRETLAMLTQAKNPPEYGVVVSQSYPGLPAARAGIKEYDVILEIDGRRIYSNVDFHRATMEKKPGDEVEIKLWSRGQARTVTVKLAARPR